MGFTPDTPGGNNWTQPQQCNDPQHFPPGLWLPPGPGTWTCPSCGHKTRIQPSKITLEVGGPNSTITC